MPDPKLQKLVAELRETIRKNDAVGIVMLSSPKNMEWGMEIETSWTCFKVENTPDGKLAIRMRNKKAEHTDMEKYKALTTDTIGTVLGFIDLLEHMKGIMEMLRGKIAETGMEITHRSTDEGPSEPPK